MLRIFETKTTDESGTIALLRDLNATAAKRYRKVLKYADAPELVRTRVESLLGVEQPCALCTNANLQQLPPRYFALQAALVQWCENNAGCSIEEWTCDSIDLTAPEPLDLRALKASFEKQVGRDPSAFVARFTVDDERWPVGLRIRLISLVPETTPGRRRKRREEPSKLWRLDYRSQFASDEAHVARCSAAFWCPPHVCSKSDTKGAIDAAVIRTVLEALMWRASLPIPETSFARGPGKLLLRTALAQINARTAALDIFRKAPLQPEGVAALLAELPISDDGSPNTLPSVRLL